MLRLADGQVQELTEYLDTDLVNQVLNDPGGAGRVPGLPSP